MRDGGGSAGASVVDGTRFVVSPEGTLLGPAAGWATDLPTAADHSVALRDVAPRLAARLAVALADAAGDGRTRAVRDERGTAWLVPVEGGVQVTLREDAIPPWPLLTDEALVELGAGWVLRAGGAWTRLTGLPTPVGPLVDAVTPATAPAVTAALAEVLAGRPALAEVRLRSPLASAGFPVAVRLWPVVDPDGDVVAAAGAFKVVNDSLGHAAGDRLLLAVAERLAAVVGPADTVARFGGDKFIVVVEDIDARGGIDQLAEDIRAQLAQPLVLDGRELFCTASVGAVVATGGESPTELLRDADAAMYRAKEQGRNRVARFDVELREETDRRLEIMSALHRVVERDELVAHYQPIIDLRTGRTWGAEALVRWLHPERGLLGPGEFVPLAEETGLVVDVDGWVLDQMCQQLAAWNRRRPPEAQVGGTVNVSARHLADDGLVSRVAAALALHRVDPHLLFLELTESAIMADPDRAAEVLSGLREIGVRLAVDDFGTGYSSLAYLRSLPVDVLKVDRAFVAGLGQDRRDSALVGAILALADELGLLVIAEGVETALQAEELRRLGCGLAQGYHFARPMLAEGLRERLP